MFKKNDVLEIEITDQGTTGEGIGKVSGYTLFVKDTVIGDVAKVKVMKAKKNYAFARLVEIVKPSKYRVEPLCPVAKSCGGCQLQAMNYQQQLKFKQEKVFNNIRRIGGVEDFVMKPIMGMEELCVKGHEENGPFHYRNKAQFPVGRDKEGKIISGFYAGRTHSIINVNDCLLGTGVNKTVMDIVKMYMTLEGVKPYDEVTHKGVVRHVLIREGKHTGQVMVCIIINGDKLPQVDRLVEQLLKVSGMTDISLNINKEKSNVILGDKIINLYGPGYIEDYIGDVKFRISPLSFFQVNPVQTEKLYSKAMEYAKLTGSETVWDLYCGIGSISLFLAKNARKVIGVEIVEPAVEDAKVNARINNIENVDFISGAAEDVVPEYFQKHKGEPECNPDVIVVDPPRKGCDEKLLNTMVLMAPKRIVYVSCDSATLARDIKWLSDKGYKLVEATPCDMFGQSVHVETVALLSKLSDVKDNIEVTVDMDEMDVTSAETKATYQKIKEYVLENAGMKVSSLYIAQAKQKYGIIERENYNVSKSEDYKQSQCPIEKEKAIVDAFRHFGMI